MYAIRSYYAITSYNVCYTKLLRSEFASIGLPGQFAHRGWLSACLGHEYGLHVLVAEFLANKSSVNTDLESFTSIVRGVRVVFSSDAIRAVLHLPTIDYP
ncbi:hypothetical protein [Desulfosporosinus sp. BG]|uniref:hypothetical protein n=1 Tax=Desulfosporosinus sp. BG TaxID=1633135 RepID=UPI00083A10F9|nr:hypothetical protein [Desulfosporosinus sp. BG]